MVTPYLHSWIDLKVTAFVDNVAVPNSMVDRGRGDPRNIELWSIGMNMTCTELQ